MRIIKEAEERRNEILDVAESLFAQKGYDKTSTNDILAEIGIARGTLYYYFRSKEDILDQLVRRMTDQLVLKAKGAARDMSVSIWKRITNTILALNVNNDIGSEVLEQMHKPQNALMHQKMQAYLLGQVAPIVTNLVEEGMKQNIFYTEYPREAAEMILIYSNEAFDDLVEQTPEDKVRRMQAFIYHAERILGAAPGSMQHSMMEIFEGSEKEIDKTVR